jgi:predicted Zn-dependent protease
VTCRRLKRSSETTCARDSDNVGALRLLARIRKEGDALEEAEALLKSVLERAPDYHAARLDYAMVLLQQEAPPGAARGRAPARARS